TAATVAVVRRTAFFRWQAIPLAITIPCSELVRCRGIARMHRSLAQSRLWVLVVVGSAWVAAPIAAQDTYTWNSSGSSATATAWLVPSNWTQNPNDVPPTPSTHFAGRVNAPNTGNSFNTDDVAYFGSTLPSNTPTAVG